MRTEEIRIRVPRRVAEAYRNAEPAKQRKMELYLTHRLTTYDEATGSSFDDVWQRLGEEAQANGLTDEKLAELLAEIDKEGRRGSSSAPSPGGTA